MLYHCKRQLWVVFPESGSSMGHSLHIRAEEEDGMVNLICTWNQLVAARDNIYEKAQRAVYSEEEGKEEVWNRTKLYSDSSDHISLEGSIRKTCFPYVIHVISTSLETFRLNCSILQATYELLNSFSLPVLTLQSSVFAQTAGRHKS